AADAARDPRRGGARGRRRLGALRSIGAGAAAGAAIGGRGGRRRSLAEGAFGDARVVAPAERAEVAGAAAAALVLALVGDAGAGHVGDVAELAAVALRAAVRVDGEAAAADGLGGDHLAALRLDVAQRDARVVDEEERADRVGLGAGERLL